MSNKAFRFPWKPARLLPVIFVLSAVGCDPTINQSLGENDIITVIADSADYDYLQSVLENALHRPVFTPQPESWFRLLRYDLADLPDHKREKNLLVMAPLDADNSVGKYLNASLDPGVRDSVQNGSANAFIKRDLWYNDQIVIFLTAPTMADLETYILNRAQELSWYYKNSWDKREKRRLYSLDREEKLEERFLEKYGWSLGIINGWFIGKDSTELQSVLLRRQAPQESERWILVHWIDTKDTRLLSSDYMYSTRNRLTEILYRTFDDSSFVRIDSLHYLQFEEVNFRGKYAIRMQGLWQMSDYSMGGPFVSYLFYDEEQERIYFLDGSLFAPKYEKKKLLQDVDVMMKTFRTIPLEDEEQPA